MSDLIYVGNCPEEDAKDPQKIQFIQVGAVTPPKYFHIGLQLQAAIMGKYPFGEEVALDQELLDAIQWVTSRTPEQVMPKCA